MMNRLQSVAHASTLLAYTVISTSLAAAESEGERLQHKHVEWGETVASIRCAIQVKPLDSSPSSNDSALCFILRTRNFGGRPIQLDRANQSFVYQVEIVGPDGKTPTVTESGRRTLLNTYDAISRSKCSLLPNEEVVVEHNLSGVYKLDPGEEYRVAFSRLVYAPDEPAQIVTSNTIVIYGPAWRPAEARKPE